MEHQWDIPLDTRDIHHPTITIVILRWHPFTYAVTLCATVENEEASVRRWDNVNKPDHVDIFYKGRPPSKHQVSRLGRIESLPDLERVLVHIERNYMRYIEEYKHSGDKNE